MYYLTCPHCDQIAFRKSTIMWASPRDRFSCPQCGGKVRISRVALILFLLTFLGPSVAAFLVLWFAVPEEALKDIAVVRESRWLIIGGLPALMFAVAWKLYRNHWLRLVRTGKREIDVKSKGASIKGQPVRSLKYGF
jgi:hypothetical protein